MSTETTTGTITGTTTEAPLIEMRDITKTFRVGGGLFRQSKAVQAVSGVDITLGRGEVLGIVGESGSGKTTIGRILTSVTTPTSGTVAYRGKDVASMDRREVLAMRRNVQMIFQNPLVSLSPRRRVIDSLVEPMKLFDVGTKDERIERARHLLAEVGLHPEDAHRYPHEFSGGQCQRICIARALMLNPDVIVCDEPVSALDVSVQAQVINLLMQLQREHGLSYVLISHDLNVVTHCCDRIAVMSQGKVVERGPAAEVRQNPQHEYTATLIDAIPGRSRQKWSETNEPTT